LPGIIYKFLETRIEYWSVLELPGNLRKNVEIPRPCQYFLVVPRESKNVLITPGIPMLF
jgi:hypothetical protein